MREKSFTLFFCLARMDIESSFASFDGERVKLTARIMKWLPWQPSRGCLIKMLR